MLYFPVLCFSLSVVSVYITHLIFPLYDGAHFPCVCVCVCRSDACVMLCGSASACTLSVCLSGFEIARSFVRSFVLITLNLPYLTPPSSIQLRVTGPTIPTLATGPRQLSPPPPPPRSRLSCLQQWCTLHTLSQHQERFKGATPNAA